MLVKFTIFNTILVFIIAYIAYFYNGFQLLWIYDPTHITYAILAILGALTVYLGIKQEKSNFGKVQGIANLLTGVGLVGSLIGVMILLRSIGSSATLTTVSQVVGPLFSGAAPVFLTTLFGVLASLIISFELILVFDKDSSLE